MQTTEDRKCPECGGDGLQIYGERKPAVRTCHVCGGTGASGGKTSLAVPCSAWVGDTAGKTLDRPTAGGWWWLKPSDVARWEPIYVYGDGVELWVDGDDLGDECGDMRTVAEVGGLWAGPLTPPVSPTKKLTDSPGESADNTKIL